MAQCDKIVEYMKSHDGITQKEAIQFDCYRLAARIFDLRERGYIIDSVREYTDGYFGHHVRYYLVKEPNEIKREVKLDEPPAETKVSFMDFMKEAFGRWKKDISN